MAQNPYIFIDDFSPVGWSVSGEQLPGPKKCQAMGMYVLCGQEQVVSRSWGASENRISFLSLFLSYQRGLFIYDHWRTASARARLSVGRLPISYLSEYTETQNPPLWIEKKQKSHLISNFYRKQLIHEEINFIVIICAASLTFPAILATMTDGNLRSRSQSVSRYYSCFVSK